MRRFSFFMLFTLISFFTLAQENTEKAEKLNYIDKKEVKSAERKIVYSNKENEEVKTDDNTTSQPVIIQHLEYNAGQNTKPSSSENSVKTEVIIEDSKPSSVKSIDEQIADKDIFIHAIDVKVEWVKNNSEEDRIAKETGWYEKMESYRQKTLQEKQELINLKK